MPPRTTPQDLKAARTALHPLRRRIVALLARRGPLTQTEVARAVGAAPASARFHILRLLRAGFIRQAGTRRGPKGITEILFRATRGKKAPRFRTAHGTKEDFEMRKLSLDEHREIHRAGGRIVLAEPGRFFGLLSWNVRATPAALRRLTRRLGRVVERFRREPAGRRSRRERVSIAIGLYPRVDGSPAAPAGEKR
ncbi:MAG: helix-turn-helix transcriptional regulator [Planctomycetes bacterium]|nr:helix-turn-helix transcriptional regulator [Planctomycetota bacterium]